MRTSPSTRSARTRTQRPVAAGARDARACMAVVRYMHGGVVCTCAHAVTARVRAAAPFAYDAVYALAHALHEVVARPDGASSQRGLLRHHGDLSVTLRCRVDCARHLSLYYESSRACVCAEQTTVGMVFCFLFRERITQGSDTSSVGDDVPSRTELAGSGDEYKKTTACVDRKARARTQRTAI